MKGDEIACLISMEIVISVKNVLMVLVVVCG